MPPNHLWGFAADVVVLVRIFYRQNAEPLLIVVRLASIPSHSGWPANRPRSPHRMSAIPSATPTEW